MFRDEVTIHVRAGDGHAGCVAMHREKYIARGGPIGGDGGKGGDVIFQADENYNTLYHLIHRPVYRAPGGEPGDSKGCSGRGGLNLTVPVPVGTIVRDAKTGALLKDLEAHLQKVVICKGGKGGRGNRRFATPTRQTPHFSEPGEPGEERRLKLELKMIADVGLVGMPNAGKSTLLSRLSAARPRVAAYPFTTLIPSLGIMKLGDIHTCVLADLPGLIEGAQSGKGLGDKFLRHIERTRIILHLVDSAPMAIKTPAEAYRIIRKEIAGYSPALAEKPEIVLATKVDALEDKKALAALRKLVKKETGGEVLEVSAAAGTGLKDLARRLAQELESRVESVESEPGSA